MENDKKYRDIRVHLARYIVKQEGNSRIIFPNYNEIDMKNIKTTKDEKKALKKVYRDFKSTLDSLDSKDSQKTLEGLFWMERSDEELSIGDVFYDGGSMKHGYDIHITHRMSYEKYLEFGKPAATEGARICKDDFKPILDRQE